MSNKRMNILIIGTDSFKDHVIDSIQSSDIKQYEHISNKICALKRLEHNSYDILIFEGDWCDQVTTCDITQLSYAMGKPSIVVCNKIINYIKYLTWFKFSKWVHKHHYSKIMLYHTFKIKSSVFKKIIDKISNSNLPSVDDIFEDISSSLNLNS